MFQMHKEGIFKEKIDQSRNQRFAKSQTDKRTYSVETKRQVKQFFKKPRVDSHLSRSQRDKL